MSSKRNTSILSNVSCNVFCCQDVSISFRPYVCSRSEWIQLRMVVLTAPMLMMMMLNNNDVVIGVVFMDDYYYLFFDSAGHPHGLTITNFRLAYSCT